jgi:5-methylcytosine-specific restriction protein A
LVLPAAGNAGRWALVTANQGINQMTNESKRIELLVKRIRYATSREWVNSYFDLVKRILDETGLKNDDPRLMMSLSSNSSGWHFPVTINNRYVVALHKKKENEKVRLYVGLIFNYLAPDIPQLQNNLVIKGGWGQFKNLPGEHLEPPYFLRFSNFPELLYWLEASDLVCESWRGALLGEVQRARRSPYRKSHEPIMYKMAVDLNFRAEILDLAYIGSKPGLGLLPEQIENPQDYYEGALQQITINAYERNPKARSACIEHYEARCIVCGFDFEENYGEIGKDFIHVHHLKPLGEVGAEYKIDPINDLCPVCPNCHAMLHRRMPPFSISELRAKLKLKR